MLFINFYLNIVECKLEHFKIKELDNCIKFLFKHSGM